MSKTHSTQTIPSGAGIAPDKADQLDQTVVNILRRLRNGETVSLPGLGRLVPDARTSFKFEKAVPAKGGARGKR